MEMDVIATWVAAISAFIGPLLGVAMAHYMSKQEVTRQEATRVFGKTMEDAQNFRHAFISQYRHEKMIFVGSEKLEALKNGIVSADTSIESQSDQIKKEFELLFKWKSEDLFAIEERYYQSHRELCSIEALLNVDKLQLGLLFDKKSEKCGLAIEELIAMKEVFQWDKSRMPSLSECSNRLTALINRIASELKPLHASLRDRHFDTDLE